MSNSIPIVPGLIRKKVPQLLKFKILLALSCFARWSQLATFDYQKVINNRRNIGA